MVPARASAGVTIWNGSTAMGAAFSGSAAVGSGVIGALSGFKNIAEVAKIQPYVDHLEFMSYFTNLTAPLNTAEHKTPADGGS